MSDRQMATYHLGVYEGREVCVLAEIKIEGCLTHLVILDQESMEAKTVLAYQVDAVAFGVGVPSFDVK